MARNIFTVTATVVANGNYNTLNGYPKRFDSNSYDGDVNKALRRAKAAFHACLGEMFAVDNRDMQTVTLTQADGRIILREREGASRRSRRRSRRKPNAIQRNPTQERWTTMDVMSWAREIHANAAAHGWHDGDERTADEYACLMASELSEALEEYRAGRPMVYGNDRDVMGKTEDWRVIRDLHLKPEGIAVELIDCVIRILDYAWQIWGEKGPHDDPGEWNEFDYHNDWDVKKAVLEMQLPKVIAHCHFYIARAWEHGIDGKLRCYDLMDCTSMILAWIRSRGIDAEALMELKHNYNKGRQYRHGGKVI